MPKQRITDKIQEMRKRRGTRRMIGMETNARNEHTRKQMETYKEKSRMLQQMMDSQEALAKELKEMEREIQCEVEREREARCKEAEQQNHGPVECLSSQDIRQLEEQVEQLTQRMDAVLEQEQKLSAALEGLGGNLEEVRKEVSEKQVEIKEELSEKVHGESVKCYRNVQSLVEETRDELKETCLKNASAQEVKGPLYGAIILGTVNLVILAALGLYELGVFDFLF